MPNLQYVLIVDDNQALRRLMASLIAAGGYRTLQAGNGAEAIEVAEKNHIDLLVTDVEMPGITGLELIRVLRDRHLVDRSLVVTGYVDYLSQPLSEFGVRCLGKPFTPDQLMTDVRELLAS